MTVIRILEDTMVADEAPTIGALLLALVTEVTRHTHPGTVGQLCAETSFEEALTEWMGWDGH